MRGEKGTAVRSLLAIGLMLFVSVGAQAETSEWFDVTPSAPLIGARIPTPHAENIIPTPTTYILNTPSAPLKFELDEKKSPVIYTNLVLKSSLLFGDCSEMPEVPAGSKFSVTVYAGKGISPTYRVYVKEPASGSTANGWIDTKIPAVVNRNVLLVLTVESIDTDVSVLFSFDGATYGPVVVLSGSVSGVACSGTGALSTLKGTCSENWIPPVGKTLPSAARSSVDVWAKVHGVRVDEFSETAVDSQGRTKYESCLLNLAPDAPLLAAVDGSRVELRSLGVAVSPPLEGVGSEVGYVLSEGGETLLSNDCGVFDVSLGEGREVFSVQAVVGGKCVGEAARVGSLRVDVGAGGGFLPVPWTDAAKGDVCVSELVKRSSLTRGDQIDVYDAERGTWTSCVFDGSQWEAANGQKIPTVARGRAFRFTPKQGGREGLYLIGHADAADVVSTPVVPNALTLVAKPDGTAFSLERLGASDKVLMMERETGLPTATYFNFHGLWLRKQTGGTVEPATEIPPNCGFFLETSARQVNW